jgi:ferredoxin-NADP reductase
MTRIRMPVEAIACTARNTRIYTLAPAAGAVRPAAEAGAHVDLFLRPDEHSVLLAGGIGITPIWAMAQRLEQLGRSWQLHASNRSREDAALLEQDANKRMMFCCSRASSETLVLDI